MAEEKKANFSENEKILAYHKGLIYDAKVLKVELKDGQPAYAIHYSGWNKNYDETVPEDRILKYSDENLERKKVLYEETMAALNKKSGRKLDVDKDKGRQAKKRKLDATTSGPDDVERKKVEIKLNLPAVLKKQLVDDWDWITREKKIVSLPRKPTVAEILDLFLQSKKKGGQSEKIFNEVIEGIRIYFDKALGTLLLYRFERPQYSDLAKKQGSKPLSEVYGAEHLLRLFVKLPQLLAHTNMEEDAANVLQQKLNEFLKFLQKNHSTFFLTEYPVATADYVKRTNS